VDRTTRDDGEGHRADPRRGGRVNPEPDHLQELHDGEFVIVIVIASPYLVSSRHSRLSSHLILISSHPIPSHPIPSHLFSSHSHLILT
jgi:hypothetical protein